MPNAWKIISPTIGFQAIDATETSALVPLGTRVRARHATYGEGEFIYLLGVASTTANSWVTYNADDHSTTLLAANAIGAVGIAMSANVASSYGWYQIYGKGIGKALTGYLDNGLVYATATAGSIDDAVVAGAGMDHQRRHRPGALRERPRTRIGARVRLARRRR